VLAFQFPGLCGVFVSSGFMIGTLGAWGTLLVLGIMSAVGIILALTFCEMATMFPENAGGTSMFLREGLRRFCIPLGVLGAFGYMLSWALAIGFNGLFVGTLIQMQWFPTSTWGVPFILGVTLGPGHFIAIGIVVMAWAVSLLGIQFTSRVSWVVGAVMIVFTLLLVIGPIVSGKLDFSALSFSMGGGWAPFVVWLYIAAYTMFGSEASAIYTPEYKRPAYDAPRGVLSVAFFMMGATMLVGTLCAGTVGETEIMNNPLNYGIVVAQSVYGDWIGPILTIVICVSMAVMSVIFTNITSRALAGMAEGGLTIKQLANLNRRGAPTWAAHVVMAVNIIALLLVSNALTLTLAANLGLVLACVLAGWSFVILRRTEPDLPRPFKLSNPLWMPLVVVVLLFTTFVFIMGVANPGLAGYGGARETITAMVFIAVGLVFWVVRVVVQDHQRLPWRDTSRTSAPSVAAGGEAGLEEALGK
jgi:amino acid transporter